MSISQRPTLPRTKALAAGAILAVASTAASASDDSADWQFGLQIYAWLPSISGNLKYTPPGAGDGIDVDADTLIDNLKMTFMGAFEARKGKWSGFTDVLYLNVGGDKSKSVSVPDGATGTLVDADLDLKGWVWTLGGAYTAWRNQKSYLDLLAGARLLALDTEVKLTGGGPLQLERKLSESENIWDGIVGAKGKIALNERWFLPYYVDVGTGNTDLTWQAAAGIGYSFDWGQVDLMYRHLEYDQDGDELLQDLAFSGGMLGVGFRF